MSTFGADVNGLTDGLTDDDVREILRLIDESELDELHIETADFRLHVSQGCGWRRSLGRSSVDGRQRGFSSRTPEHPAPQPSRRRADGLPRSTSPMLGTFYRAEAPGRGALRRGRHRGGAGHDRLPSSR